MIFLPKKRDGLHQISTFIPASWKPILEQEARILGVQESRNINYLDLIKLTIKEKFNLPD